MSATKSDLTEYKVEDYVWWNSGWRDYGAEWNCPAEVVGVSPTHVKLKALDNDKVTEVGRTSYVGTITPITKDEVIAYFEQRIFKQKTRILHVRANLAKQRADLARVEKALTTLKES